MKFPVLLVLLASHSVQAMNPFSSTHLPRLNEDVLSVIAQHHGQQSTPNDMATFHRLLFPESHNLDQSYIQTVILHAPDTLFRRLVLNYRKTLPSPNKIAIHNPFNLKQAVTIPLHLYDAKKRASFSQGPVPHLELKRFLTSLHNRLSNSHLSEDIWLDAEAVLLRSDIVFADYQKPLFYQTKSFTILTAVLDRLKELSVNDNVKVQFLSELIANNEKETLLIQQFDKAIDHETLSEAALLLESNPFLRQRPCSQLTFETSQKLQSLNVNWQEFPFSSVYLQQCNEWFAAKRQLASLSQKRDESFFQVFSYEFFTERDYTEEHKLNYKFVMENINKASLQNWLLFMDDAMIYSELLANGQNKEQFQMILAAGRSASSIKDEFYRRASSLLSKDQKLRLGLTRALTIEDTEMFEEIFQFKSLWKQEYDIVISLFTRDMSNPYVKSKAADLIMYLISYRHYYDANDVANLGFGVPVERVKELVKDWMKNGYMQELKRTGSDRLFMHGMEALIGKKLLSELLAQNEDSLVASYSLEEDEDNFIEVESVQDDEESVQDDEESLEDDEESLEDDEESSHVEDEKPRPTFFRRLFRKL